MTDSHLTEKKDFTKLPVKFRNYYLACRNKGEVLHGLGETSPWRAFKFACRMAWSWIRDPEAT